MCKLPHSSDTVCTDCMSDPKRVAQNELVRIMREKREQIEALEAEIKLLDQAWDLL